MIFIDGEEEPSINGTGSEDYFGHAWGMQKNGFLYNGSIIHESDKPGYQVSYRFHIADPIHFNESIKVTLEHGHANHLSDDWSSTAYWYQTLPSPKLDILPVEERLPHVAKMPEVKQKAKKPLTEEQQRAYEAAKERETAYISEKLNQMEIKYEKTRSSTIGNIEHAKRVKASIQQAEK
jgi:hypothetical protein